MIVHLVSLFQHGRRPLATAASAGRLRLASGYRIRPPRVTGQLNEFVDVSLTTRCCVCARGGEADAPLCTRLRSQRDTHGLLLGEAPSREQLEQWPLYAGGASWMERGIPATFFSPALLHRDTRWRRCTSRPAGGGGGGNGVIDEICAA